MKIHEYQAKGVLASFGVPVPRGRVASTPEEAESAARELGGDVFVVKAQIHAGGRGKGGGVKVVRGIDAVAPAAKGILGKPLITHQTGPEGKEVLKVLVEEGCRIRQEIYFGIVVDRKIGVPVAMACEEGGVEIEEVASRSPEKILKEPFDPFLGLSPYKARRLAFRLGLGPELNRKAESMFLGLSRSFLGKDCSLLEINPLVITEEGSLMALDAKINFDDNALYRHPDVVELRDTSEEDAAELRANDVGLNYIRLDGEIGCMVNGAGLAMATMDIIKLYGGEPANFLDVGGGASQDQITEAFQIIVEDPRVKTIFVNIFGGIVRCDVIARGIEEAVKKTGLTVPLVVRLEGTKVEEGREILRNTGLEIATGNTMSEAARKAVELSRKGDAA
jgi:succinyl-CoA synthetase beta subunit